VREVDRCEECGFEYELGEAARAGQSIVEGAVEFAAVLGSHTVI
jgi:hypothetical protein